MRSFSVTDGRRDGRTNKAILGVGFEHICTTLSGFLFRDLRCCHVYLRLLYQLKCLLESALADVYHLLPAPHFLRSWKGYWRFGEWMRGNIQDFQEISTRRLQSQKSASALRDRWMGWEGDLASRFLGNRSRVWAREGKSGRSFGLKSQH